MCHVLRMFPSFRSLRVKLHIHNREDRSGKLSPSPLMESRDDLPKHLSIQRPSKCLSKGCSVCGAAFFVAEDSALTALGVSSCALIYRLTQRGVLVNLLAFPVACLLTFDSVVSCLISYSLCGPADLTAMRDWSLWIETPQVFVLLTCSECAVSVLS